MVEENTTQSKYERDKIIIEEDSKVNRILNPYSKIRETIKDMIDNGTEE